MKSTALFVVFAKQKFVLLNIFITFALNPKI